LVVVQFHWIYIQVPFMIILWTIGLRKVRAATNHPIKNIQTTKK
jgi:protease PrsW